MRIAIIVTLFPPRWLAGTEIATYKLAENLAKRGHEVHVITSQDEGTEVTGTEKGFFIHRSPIKDIRFLGSILFWKDMFWTIRKIDPDIVHVQSLICSIPALFSNRLLKIPYVIYGRGSDVYLPEWFTRLSSKIILKNAESVIALTGDMKTAMQAIYDRDISVVPNGIDLRGYTEKPPIQRLEESEKTILFVGRLHPIKGVEFLIQAMQLVHAEMPDVKLVLVGDGDERGYLEDLTDRLGIGECVEFVGRIPHNGIQGYMDDADVFVLPSLSEGFPVTILEAMACGLPVVATRVGGLPDIIENGINGFLIETKNVKELADILHSILQDGQMRDRISADNREEVKKYSWENVVGLLEGIYEKTVISSQ